MAAGWSVMDAINRNSKAAARQTEGTVQNQRHQREEDVQQRHEFLFKAGY